MKKIIETTLFYYLISIERDSYPSNPRTEWDNMGTMSLPNRNYSLTDKNAIDDLETLRCYLGVETDKGIIEYQGYENHQFKGVCIGLDFMEYGGGSIRIRETKDFENADGFIYAEKTAILKEFGGKNLTKIKKEKALQILRGELSTFTQYIDGDVFGYSIERVAKQSYPDFEDMEQDEKEELIGQQGSIVASCWGFYYANEEKMYKDNEKDILAEITYDSEQNEKAEKDRIAAEKEKEAIKTLQLTLPLSDKEKEFNIKVVEYLHPCILD